MAYEIELTPREDVGDSWILSYGPHRHCGYVQKMSGNVHLFSSVPIECKSEIKKQVEEHLGRNDLSVSRAVDIPTGGDEDEFA
jgi:hypothetical protein